VCLSSVFDSLVDIDEVVPVAFSSTPDRKKPFGTVHCVKSKIENAAGAVKGLAAELKIEKIQEADHESSSQTVE
jgi:hypothetical protein